MAEDPEQGIEIEILPHQDNSVNGEASCLLPPLSGEIDLANGACPLDEVASPLDEVASSENEQQEFVPELPKVWEPFPPFKRSNNERNRQDNRWWSPLHEAIDQMETRRLEGMGPERELLRSCIMIQDPEKGMTPAHVAVSKGKLDLVKILLEQDLDFTEEQIKSLKIQNFDGRTVLHEACMLGHLEIVCWLCDENGWVGWDPTDKNTLNCNAAFFAASYGHLDVLKYLLSRCGQEGEIRLIGQRHKQKYTILHGAVYYKRLDDLDQEMEEKEVEETEKRKLLQKRNEDLELKKQKPKKMTMFMLTKAVQQHASMKAEERTNAEEEEERKQEKEKQRIENAQKQELIDQERLELVQYLVGEIVRLQIFEIMDKKSNTEEITALYLAAKLGHVKLVTFLMKYVTNIEVDCRNVNKAIMLHDAAEHNRVDVVRYLCEESVFKDYIMDKQNIWAAIPFSGAASGNNPKIMRMILDYGKEAGIAEQDMILYQNTFNWSSLHDTAVRGHIEATKFLCNHQDGINIVPLRDSFGSLALHLAAMGGHNEILKILFPLTEAASSINEKNYKRNTPLHEAASRGRSETVQLFLETPHVTLFRRGQDDSSVLHEAVRSGSTDCVRRFLDFKDKMPLPLTMVTKTDGNTPLHLAISLQHTEIALMCLAMETGGGQFHAVNIANKKGLTPLAQAAMAGNFTIVDAIMARIEKIELTPYRTERSDFNYGDYNPFGTFPWICEEGRSEFIEKNRTPLQFHGNGTINETSPINCLIRRCPEVVVAALDKCWCHHLTNDEENKKPGKIGSTDGEVANLEGAGRGEHKLKSVAEYFRVIINFNIIEKYVAKTKTDSNGKETADEGSSSFKTVGNPYEPDAYIEDEAPLQVMSREKNVELLTHPVVQALVDIKWRNYGFHYYASSALIKLVFVALLLSYTLIVHNDVFKDSTWNCTEPSNETSETVKCTMLLSEKSDTASGLGIALLVLVAVLLLAELVDFIDDTFDEKRGFKKYLQSNLNIVESVSYIVALVFVSMTVFSDEISSGMWQVSAAAVVCSFINILFTLRAISFLNIGLHIIMFFKIVITFIRSIGALLVVFVLGFVCVFHLLSAGGIKSQYSSFTTWSAYYKTLSMGVSGVAYEDYDSGEEDIAMQLINGHVVALIFFAIVIQILFMNLATGLAIEDVKEIRDNSKVEVNIVKIRNIYKTEQLLLKLGRFLNTDFFQPKFVGELRKYVNIPLSDFKIKHDT